MSHQGQPIALVIADTLEQANHAATLVRVTYAPETGDHRHQPASSRFCRPAADRPGERGRRDAARRSRRSARGRRGQDRPDLRDPAREPQSDRDARHHRGLGRRSPDAVGQDAVGAQHGRRDRRRVRHSGGEHPRRLALRRRRLRLGAAHLAACDAGGARRPRRRAPGQADAVAARDVLRRRLPPAHGPARRPRRVARRPPRRHRARRIPGDLHLRGVYRGAPQPDPVPAFVPERLHAPSPRAA